MLTFRWFIIDADGDVAEASDEQLDDLVLQPALGDPQPGDGHGQPEAPRGPAEPGLR